MSDHVMRCKLQLNTVEEILVRYQGCPEGRKRGQVQFGAVYGDKGENQIFGDSTPSASFTASIYNEQVIASLAPGKKYYVTFTEAPD